jgi:hypothetical protein
MGACRTAATRLLGLALALADAHEDDYEPFAPHPNGYDWALPAADVGTFTDPSSAPRSCH